ncbi:hypothetical protein [Haloechinothrix sp. LS1_15]|uniref:hypothetical protein n=1 Tax=Haloechinothrix sp. LS1_15 TaxID=2652248 RepID=UPI0029479D19|nr:hypothetical protein [Haloechinothrix sp. LS1_15]MDV6011186.1 hypothetical protein [Haloechinothrix sp. LS1_15]
MSVTAAVAASLVLASCVAPPGPEPGMPAPEIPEDAVAYDERKSTAERPFPFTGDCAQITSEVAQQAGMTGDMETPEESIRQGCVVRAGGDQPFGWLGVHELIPRSDPDRDEDTPAFDSEWDGGSWTGGHFQRSILLDRYYAVTRVDNENGYVNCTVAVDTGSLPALEFVGYLEEEASRQKHDELFEDQFTSEPKDREALDAFAAEQCTVVSKAAEVLLDEAIDPEGGSLATELAE